jgi:DNA-binding transcriptional LysR family regulator
MDTLASMRAFVRVVELGGISPAARALGLSPTMVAKHLAHLEDRTSARLLDRTTRSVRPTPAGQAYLERVTAILEAIEEAEGLAASDTSALRGTLRLTTPVEFGQEHLAPLVVEFMARHPEVAVVADFSNRTVDLVQEGFDLAIRIASSLDTALVGRRLASSRFFVVASRECLDRVGRPEAPEDLARRPALSFASPEPRLDWPWKRGNVSGSVHVAPQLLSTSSETLRRAAVAGAGFSWLPSFVCGRDIREGRLVPVLEDHDWGQLGLYALYPHRRFVPSRLRAFIDFVAERLGGKVDGDPWTP